MRSEPRRPRRAAAAVRLARGCRGDSPAQAGHDHAHDQRGARLPDEVLERLQPLMPQVLASPDDVAEAVWFAVAQPMRVNIADIVVRPAKQLNL